MQRLSSLNNNLQTSLTSQEKKSQVIDHASSSKQRTKLDFFKLKGWGYKDTQFVHDTSNHKITLAGTHYAYSGRAFPKLYDFIKQETGMTFTDRISAKKDLEIDPSILNSEFVETINAKQEQSSASSQPTHKYYSRISFAPHERIQHSHGHSLQEVYAIRYSKLPRYVDCVIYPESEAQCQNLVAAANKFNVVLIPYGGGTNVSQALLLRSKEKRMICSIDMTRMNKILWVDRNNNTACIQCGILGRDLEKELAKYGMVCGHEPDSFEFSSLGGWISTRASGMKKNVYGNIEDIVSSVKLVTAIGTFDKECDAPRVSTGPDLTNFLIGSEGNFGLLTSAVIKVREAPESKVYGSIVFPDFELGIRFMRELARTRDWPASARLVDNMQFRFGVALKPQENSRVKQILDKIKKYYVTQIKGFDVNKMCALTLVFEGTKARTDSQQKLVYGLAKKFYGLKGGEENGIRGYFLTFMIAYIRDFVLDHYYMGESFETAVPWDKVSSLCKNVASKIISSCEQKGVKGKAFASFRVTQVYETGACIYIYFGFSYKGLENAVETYTEIEHEAREEIMKNGGSLSHHHGVGKIRKPFFADVTGSVGIEMLKAMKSKLDPKNIFATGNLIDA